MLEKVTLSMPVQSRLDREIRLELNTRVNKYRDTRLLGNGTNENSVVAVDGGVTKAS